MKAIILLILGIAAVLLIFLIVVLLIMYHDKSRRKVNRFGTEKKRKDNTSVIGSTLGVTTDFNPLTDLVEDDPTNRNLSKDEQRIIFEANQAKLKRKQSEPNEDVDEQELEQQTEEPPSANNDDE